MFKNTIICGLLVLLAICGFANYGFSSDSGPSDLKLTSSTSSKKPPAIFPHKKHQETLKCSECHHDIKDGKQAPYTEGMEIKKCESCHNPELLAGKKIGKNKLDSFKGAAHENCLGCHKDVAKKDESKKQLKSCKTCHKK